MKSIMWQYTHDPNDINDAIKNKDEDWEEMIGAPYAHNNGR